MSVRRGTQLGLEHHNMEQSINRLPFEVLSCIFKLGRQKSDELAEKEKLSFGELVAQVCRHWRTIALATPMLWSYITLSDPIPYERSAMLLARSGDSAPIDIHIDMNRQFMKGLRSFEDYAKRARAALEFIVAHGGVTSRWETLVIRSKRSETIQGVMDFVYNARLDNLHTLELDVETYKVLDADELVADVLTGQASSESAMFKNQPPLLRHIELYGMPSKLILPLKPPIVCNLTLLHLTVAHSLPDLVSLRDLFIHSPRLETLGLYTSRIESTDFQNQPPAVAKVHMPHLRQFTRHQWDSTSWGLSVLKMVDAPAVEVFSLDYGDSDAVLSYLAFGRRGERLVDDHSGPNEHIGGTSIYPALKHLIISGISGSPDTFSNMLKAFQNVTKLDWELRMDPDNQLLGVLRDSTICPQLEHIRAGWVPNELIAVVRERAEQGRPLKVVEVSSRFWDEIPGETKQELKSMLERFEPCEDLEF
ncbi:hypothetical protein BDV93DRAFT_603083 [Ceratobasidium sp. AG-I]|nr:hypothetical protein BDV93DRAFT_603083 [Ceratobasidium sp. AG-I]